MTPDRSRAVDAVLRAAISGDAPRRVVLDPAFQGLPDTAHGGAVLALFDAVAALHAPRTLAGTYRRRVPLATALRLDVAPGDHGAAFRLREGDTLLVDGTVGCDGGASSAARAWAGGPGWGSPAPVLGKERSAFLPAAESPADPHPGPPAHALAALGGLPLAERPAHVRRPSAAPPTSPPIDSALPADSSGMRSTNDPRPSGQPLPISKTCFACGIDNPLGLRAQLHVDDRLVGGVWKPHASLRSADGPGLATVALTTLLDEAAFWLGAAASGESGMTTELRVRLERSVVHGPVIFGGARAAVRARAGDPRYWDTAVVAFDGDGGLVATADITFVAVRGAARKLVAGLLAVNPPDVLKRVFPAYVA